MEFEWDDAKAARNQRQHGVGFVRPAKAFLDPFAVEWIDDRQDYGEERIILLGVAEGRLLTIVYTQRSPRIRLISARAATKHEQDIYFRENAP
jgi:uncharacterized DUF497 family protein